MVSRLSCPLGAARGNYRLCIAQPEFSTLPFSQPAGDIGKESLKAIDAVEMHKHLMLSSAMSLQHLKHGRFEIIVDHHARHSTPEFKSMALAKQEGFLPLGGEALDKHRSTKAESSGQERNLHQLACKLDRRFAKVKLCPLAWSKVERNKGWFRGLLFLLDIHAHGGFSDRDTQLAQFDPHTMRCPALFWRPAPEPLILFEPLLNMRKSGVAHRRLVLSLAPIATLFGSWLLFQQLGDRIA